MKHLRILFIAVLLIGITTADALAQTRIRFARGRTSASASSSIGSGSGRSYVLSARRGQNLSANVSSRNGCVKFKDEGSTSTSFTTVNGDNVIWLINNCSRPTTFVLTVSINY
jgi:hypothetical protein